MTQAWEIPRVHQVFMALWKTEWIPRNGGNTFPDPTICFLALNSLKSSGEFAQPKEVTKPIAILCWAIKMSMTAEIHRLVDSGEAADQITALNMVNQYVVDHQPTTFGSLRSITHYATSITISTMAPPNIIWNDFETFKSLRFEGQLITFDQVQHILETLETKVVDLWQRTVLKGLDVYVRHSDLADDMTDTSAGYSFLDNPTNGLDSHFFDLGQAMFSDPTLWSEFFTQPPGAGNWQPNVPKCRKWLVDLAMFERFLMAGIDMTGGAPPRATEIGSFLIRNTPFRVRNFFVAGHHKSFIRQYDKTTNNKQRDQFIPHSIANLYADLFIQLHVLARPLAQVCPDLIEL